MTFQCWVVDDEVAAHKGLTIALKPYTEFTICEHFYAIDELPLSLNNTVDVVFLDIEMPRSNGFTFFEHWQGQLPLVVFVTAHQQYALQAFEKHAFDYLLKPIDSTRFNTLVKRLRQRLTEKVRYHELQKANNEGAGKQNSISVQTDDGLIQVQVCRIVYIQAVGDFVSIKLLDQDLLTRSTLKVFVARLSAFGIVQIHRSYAVNINMVLRVENTNFGDGLIYLKSGDVLKLSRRYKKSLLAFL